MKTLQELHFDNFVFCNRNKTADQKFMCAFPKEKTRKSLQTTYFHLMQSSQLNPGTLASRTGEHLSPAASMKAARCEHGFSHRDRKQNTPDTLQITLGSDFA
jgi:hypothetical protein